MKMVEVFLFHCNYNLLKHNVSKKFNSYKYPPIIKDLVYIVACLPIDMFKDTKDTLENTSNILIHNITIVRNFLYYNITSTTETLTK